MTFPLELILDEECALLEQRKVKLTFLGKIITLSGFLSAPKKGYNLHTLGPQWTFAKKRLALKVLMVHKAPLFCRKVVRACGP
jgi:hypothetical protein